MPAPPPAKAAPVKAATLPLISVLPKSKMAVARELMEELASLVYIDDPDHPGTKIKHEARVSAVKSQLAELQSKFQLQGLRYGQTAFYSKEMSGRRTLSKEKLLSFMTAAQIETCYDEGAPYITNTFKLLGVADGDG